MRQLGRTLAAAGVAALLFAAPAPAAADDIDFGVRGGYYFDVGEPFLGAEALLQLSRRIFFNPNLEYVFVDNGSLLTANADVHYDLPTSGSAYVWIGGGLAAVRVDPDGPDNGDTDLGVNALAGFGFRSRGAVPYFQLKAILKDETEFSLAFGVRF